MEETPDAVVAALPENHLDAGNAEDFKRALETVIAGCDRVVLDIGPLEFVDSSGLGAIISCLRKLSAKHGQLKPCNASRQVGKLFQMVRIHHIVEVFDNRQDALASFAAKPE